MKRNIIVLIASLAAISLLFSVACSKKSSGGDPLEGMIKHMSAMVQIMKDNKDDCDKLSTKLEAYTKEHKADLQALKKAGEEMEQKMTDEEKKAFEEKAMKKMEPIMKDVMTLSLEISQKCPDKAAAIGNAMNVLQ